jgi:hypothetical protein
MNERLTPGPIIPPPRGYLAAKVTDDLRIVAVMPRFYGACITIGKDWTGYTIGWDFADVFVAVAEAKRWDPLKQKEPNGWQRCHSLGKPHRRRPDGDPAGEFADVEHRNLQSPGDSDSALARVCPFCQDGRLLVTRDPVSYVLQELDVCLLCGQRVKYADIAELRKKDWARTP